LKTLQIDDETYSAIRARADEQGLSIDDWLRRAAAHEPDPRQLDDREVRRAKLHAFARGAVATGHPLDDSRESIYD
jgi:hypothetical protein